MKKVFLILLTAGAVALTLWDMGVPIFLYTNLPALLTALAGFYIWAASGEGAISSLGNIRRGADGAILMSWISVMIGLIAGTSILRPIRRGESLCVVICMFFTLGLWVSAQVLNRHFC